MLLDLLSRREGCVPERTGAKRRVTFIYHKLWDCCWKNTNHRTEQSRGPGCLTMLRERTYNVLSITEAIWEHSCWVPLGDAGPQRPFTMKGGWQGSRAERSLGPETTDLREKQHADCSHGAILKHCGRLVAARVSMGKRMKKAWYIHTWSVSLT